jgi:putative ABC transport system permease protein
VPGLVPGAPPDELDISVPADVVPMGAGYNQPIMSLATLRRAGTGAAGIGTRVSAIAARPALPPTQAQRDALAATLAASPVDIYVEQGADPGQSSPLPLVLAIAAGIVALGAAAIATGLAAADSRADLTTLAAVGAAPRVRRSLSLAQSGIIAGLGSVLGAVAGFGAAAAVITGLNQQWVNIWPAPDPLPIRVPWTNLLISLVVVPAVAMLGAGLLTRSRLPSERRAT